MTPERWSRVKDIFHIASEVPPAGREAVLSEHCGDDHDLRAQVQSLLESHEEAETDSRLENPAHLEKPETIEQIGPYQILEKIGAGGMGEVYRALDTRLKRIVALKILLEEYSGNADLIRRFHREARAVSALEHPNICRLYDIGDYKGRPYFTMELIEGQTLRQRIQSGPIEIHDALHIGTQIACALQAAHQRGFLHRDIKPTNIFLARNGEVKVVDFGLAKPFQEDSEFSGSLTNSRMIPGTPSYMSPEQALGDPLDARSDIFSLAVVLYEMALRQQPFPGDTPAQVLDKILNSTPPNPSAVNPHVPREFDRIVLKALSKRREDRQTSVDELLSELRLLLDPPTEDITPLTAVERRSGRWWVAPVAVLVFGLLVAVTFVLRPKSGPGREAVLKLTPLDAAPGPKEMPALSPEGDRIAFAASERHGAPADIYVKLLGAGSPLQLTKTPASEAEPVFSPDGKFIAFVRTGVPEPAYYVIPVLGGGERRVARAYLTPIMIGGRTLDWSPDGKYIVIANAASHGEPMSLFRVSMESQDTAILLSGESFYGHPAYSPDGKWLAYAAGPSPFAHDLYVMPAAGGKPVRLTFDHTWLAGISWTPDSQGIVFSSNRGGLFSLWRIAATGTASAGLVGTIGPDAYTPVIAKGGQMAFLRRKMNVNLWRVPTDGSRPPVRFVESGRSSAHADFSPDGERIAFSSDRSGTWQIWVCRGDGSDPNRITSMASGQTGSPRWSPDGKWIAFDARPNGDSDIYITTAEGGSAGRLTGGKSDDYLPSWAHDGRSIFFASNRGGEFHIWRQKVGEATAEEVTRAPAEFSMPSSDGSALYFVSNGSLFRKALPDGAEEKVIDGVYWYDVALGARGIYFVPPGMESLQDVVLLTPQDRRLTALKGIGPRAKRLSPITLSPDGKWLVFDRVDQSDSEIMIVENFR